MPQRGRGTGTRARRSYVAERRLEPRPAPPTELWQREGTAPTTFSKLSQKVELFILSPRKALGI